MINETNFRVDVDGADPRVREVCAVHGEDIRFTAQFYRRGVAVALAGATAEMCYRDAVGVWHYTAAEVDGNAVIATWSRSWDTGADAYEVVLRAVLDGYVSCRALVRLRLTGGFDNTVVPVPAEEVPTETHPAPVPPVTPGAVGVNAFTWCVDVADRAGEPLQLGAVHGEDVYLTAVFRRSGVPLPLAGATAELYYRDAASGDDVWHYAAAAVDGDSVSSIWRRGWDTGADAYEVVLRVALSGYVSCRALARLTMRGGFDNAIPVEPAPSIGSPVRTTGAVADGEMAVFAGATGERVRRGGLPVTAGDVAGAVQGHDDAVTAHGGAEGVASGAAVAIAGHVATVTGNPHGVTAAETGAYTAGAGATLELRVGSVEGAAAGAASAVAAHTGDTSNPHGTTAEQAGAYPAEAGATLAGAVDTLAGAVGDLENALGGKADKALAYEVRSGTVVTVAPGHSYTWSATGACTLTAAGWTAGQDESASIIITAAAGATVAGSGVTVVDAPVAGKVNHCFLRNCPDGVKLFVTYSV